MHCKQIQIIVHILCSKTTRNERLKGVYNLTTIHYPHRPVHGTLRIPGDKSISHRAIMLGAIAKGKTTIEGFLTGDDCLRTIEIFKQLGVNITLDHTNVTIDSPGIEGWENPSVPLYCGNSGTTARLMLGILASSHVTATLTGDDSLSKRPMDRVVKPLQQMGAQIEAESDELVLPLTIIGKALRPIHYKSPVASAQVKSAILFAGLQTEGRTSVEENAISRDHTEQMLRYFGAEMTTEQMTASIEQGAPLIGKHVEVPGDISSAAFFLVAAALVEGSALTLERVGLNETRTGIIDVLQQMGANIRIDNASTENGEPIGDIIIEYAPLTGTQIGGDIIPRLIDELPIIALLATQASGTTVIKDAEELRVKETDRILAVTTELSKIGANIEATADGMIIHGLTPLTGGKMNSYGDHRLGMMAGIASLITKEAVTIEDAACIDISYPSFFEHIQSVTESE